MLFYYVLIIVATLMMTVHQDNVVLLNCMYVLGNREALYLGVSFMGLRLSGLHPPFPLSYCPLADLVLPGMARLTT